MGETIIQKQKSFLDVREIWSYRELLFFFSLRDLQVKYKQTVFGLIWVFLQPLIMMFIFYFFFAKPFKIDTGKIPYTLYVFSGLLIWNLFSGGLNAASNSIVQNANIIKKIYFPRIIIPISSVMVSLVDFLVGWIVFVPMLLYYKVDLLTLEFLIYLPLSIFNMILITVGFGLLLSSLNTLYRDFRYIIPFIVQILFFISPILYNFEDKEFNIPILIQILNPLCGVFSMFRHALFLTPIDLKIVIINMIFSFIFMLIGVVVFSKLEPKFADFA